MLRFLFFHLILCLLCPKVYGQTTACEQLPVVRATLDVHHIGGPMPNDTLARRWSNTLIDALDPEALFFTQEDLDFLQPLLALSLSQPEASCSALEKIRLRYRQRIKQAEGMLSAWQSKPIAWNNQQHIDLHTYNAPAKLLPSQNTLHDRWDELLKSQCLLSSTPTKTTVSDSIISQVCSRFSCLLSQLLPDSAAGRERFQLTLLNSLAQAYDPHSNYFSDQLMEGFETSLSQEAPSFGLQLEDSPSGAIVVARLIPGGPAWQSNSIREGDRLLSISLPDSTVITTGCKYAEEVEEVLNGSATVVLFRFMRAGGETYTLRLKKELLTVEENQLSGFLFSFPFREGKVGYIALPSFYTDWENEVGCANDVAKELLKLKRENIQALILDLRYNGGGALTEALNLAGLFIDQGPLLVGKKKQDPPIKLHDPQRGSVYDGPLLVLVNEYSASAAEIVASILQEKGRALVAGNTTFGKANGQSIYPVGKGKQQAYVKVTESRYFNLGGSSYQGKGVQPDIFIRHAPHPETVYQEKDLPYSLQQSSLVDFEGEKPNALPLHELLLLQKERHPLLDSGNRNSTAKADFASVADATIRLHPDFFWQDWEKVTTAYHQACPPEAPSSEPKLLVNNTRFDADLLAFDEHKKLLNNTAKQTLAQDPSISEATHIALDLFFLLHPQTK